MRYSGGFGRRDERSCGGERVAWRPPVVTVTHVGPYDQLKGTWDGIMVWVQSEGLTLNGAPWEVYVDDPTTVDPSTLRTEIYVPVESS